MASYVSAVPTLIAVLGGGPSVANRQKLEKHLKTTYGQMRKQAEKHEQDKILMSESEFLKTYMENYVALYQSRAAEALGAIGGSDATRALRDAEKAPLREDAKEVVRKALEGSGE